MNTTLPKPLMLSIALLQGLCLCALYQAVRFERWPGSDPVWLFILLSFFIAVPTFFLLLVNKQNLPKALYTLAPVSVVMVLVAVWSGLQLTPKEFIRNEVVIFPFIFTMSIAVFKALMYAQEYCAGTKISYSSLFEHSWRNFLTLCLSLLFTLLFFGILLLWGLLFELINIGFFRTLFREEWFFFPAGSVAFTFAIIIFRSLSKIIDSISALLEALIKFLLPLLVGIALVFLLALFFQGFTPLWETNYGSGLILWLQALLLFSVNAVYQGNIQERPYPLVIHRIIYLGVATLPVYSVIALYGLFTRIVQYGLTVQRCWAVLVALVLFFFALGYLWSIISKKDNWLEGLAWINVRMGLLVMAVMILVNSPVASFQKLSVQNQIQRLHSGALDIDNLDLNYFRYSLGRQGYLALQEVKEEYGENNPRLITEIDAIYRNRISLDTQVMTLEQLKEALTVWPAGRVLPDSILQAMLGQNNSASGGADFDLPPAGIYPGIAPLGASIFLSPDDLYYGIFIEMNTQDSNSNNTEEIIFIRETIQDYRFFYLWTMQDAEWQVTSLSTMSMDQGIDLSEALQDNQVSIIPSQWNDIEIGGIRLSVPEQMNRFQVISGFQAR